MAKLLKAMDGMGLECVYRKHVRVETLSMMHGSAKQFDYSKMSYKGNIQYLECNENVFSIY